MFNNRLTGKFLGSPGYSFGMLSGQMSDIGYDVQFTIRYVASGCYDIRLTSNSKYLTRSSTSMNVVLQPTLDVNYSLWKIETYTYNGYTYHYFRNASTNEYLTWQNGTLKVVSTIGYEGTEAFYACSWRVAEYAGYLEPASISIFNMVLQYSTVELPTVFANPINSDLCAPHEFVFAYDSSYLGSDVLSGSFWLTRDGEVYTKTVTAVHKPTGITTNFTIASDYRGGLIGVDDLYNYHDHSSALYTISTKIKNCGYASASVYTGAFTRAEIYTHWDTTENKIFVSRSHGEVVYSSSGESCATLIYLDAVSSSTVHSDEIFPNADYSNMKIVVFAGCYTAADLDTGVNLPEAMVQHGAKVAIGFKVGVNCALTNQWIIQFFTYLEQGQTVAEAILELNKNTAFEALEPCVYGDASTKLS